MLERDNPNVTNQEFFAEVLHGNNVQNITLDCGVGNTQRYLGNQDICEIKFIDALYTGENPTYGSKTKQVEITLLNNDRVKAFSWNNEIKISMTVKIGDQTPANVDGVEFGYFIGEMPKFVTNEPTVKYIGYDRMYKFDVIADPYIETIQFPITIANICRGVCNYVGIPYNDYFPQWDYLGILSETIYSLPNEMMKGVSCRQIITWIAEASAMNAHIDQQGQLHFGGQGTISPSIYSVSASDEFSYYDSEDISEAMTWNEFDQLTWNEADGYTWDEFEDKNELYAYDYVNISLSDDKSVECPSTHEGFNGYFINNPFLIAIYNFDVRYDYISAIYNKVRSISSYSPKKVSCLGAWLIEAGDFVTVQMGNEQVKMCISYMEMSFNGSCRVSYEYDNSLSKSYGNGSQSFKHTQTLNDMLILQKQIDDVKETIKNDELVLGEKVDHRFAIGQLDYNTLPSGFAEMESTASNSPNSKAAICFTTGENSVGSKAQFAITTAQNIVFYRNYSTANGWSTWSALVPQIEPAFSSLSDLIDYIKSFNTGDTVNVRINSALSASFLNTAVTIGSAVTIIKASANNAYYFLRGRDVIAYGNISLTNGTVSIVHDIRTVYDQLEQNTVYYGVSSTAAGTQTKAVTIAGFPTALTDGLRVRIKFTNNQTYNGQPQLNINSLGAVPICRYGTTAAARYEWIAGSIIDFVYDGTNFVMVGGGIATTTYYGRTKLSDASNSTSSTLAATPKAVNNKIVTTEISTNLNVNSHCDVSKSGYIPISVYDVSQDGTHTLVLFRYVSNSETRYAFRNLGPSNFNGKVCVVWMAV